MPSPVSAETMKVRSNWAFSLRAAVSARSFERSIRSILLRIRTLGRRISGSLARMASPSSSRPRRQSIRSATTSASPAPPQAEVTMARSSRRFGAKMPGVSTKMICDGPSSAMPRTSVRVVCTLRETIDTFEPTKLLSSVDLPAFGAPIRATKPHRVASLGTDWASGSSDIRGLASLLLPDPLAYEDLLGRVLLGGAFRAACSDRLLGPLHPRRHLEARGVVEPRALDHDIDWGRPSQPLGPFLK